VALVTTGEIVSVTTRFVIVAVPVFTTTMLYVTGAPEAGALGVWILDTVRPGVAAGKATPTADVLKWFTCAHAIPPVAYAVFETCVGTHTTPYRPEIVNVVEVPGHSVSAAPVQTNMVPDAPPVATGAAQPAGVPATAPTTTGEMVSTTVRFVIVAAPMFATVIVYATGAPAHAPPTSCFVTVKSMVGAARTNPVDGLVLAATAAHAPLPSP
jgi:hypothetical protein